MANYMIDVFCRKCRSQLFRYLKEGEGHLMKCYVSNITGRSMDEKKPLYCPECDTQFARDAMIHGRPAYKIIQGKVFVRR